MSADEFLPGMTPEEAFIAGRQRGEIDALYRPVADLPRGISLRDFFAAFSLAGMRATESPEWVAGLSASVAELAYADADAMLAERANGGDA